MIALFPLLWLHWQLVLHSFLTDKFLDNVSNKASVDSEEEDSGDSSDEDEDSRRSRLHQNGGLGHHRQINIPLHRQQPQPQKEQPPPLPPFEVSTLSPPLID